LPVTTVQLWTGHETRPLRASSGEGRSATAADRVPVWTESGTLAVAQVIGGNRLLPKARFIVQEMFPEDPAQPAPP
jgi:hypothetical protein